MTDEQLTSAASEVRTIASVSSPTRLDFYDAELRAHHEHLRAAYGISPGDEVLDIGCGTGLTTREAARAAAPGRVVGVDVSEGMLERAREKTAAEQLDNVRYDLGDAQVHRFDPAGFDVAISRFGTMFFSDPAAAFANIAAALRPEARLVLLVWQRHDHNGWARAIDAALGDAAQPPQPGADPFSLGDAEATAGILEGAGFDGIRFEDVHEPVLYGHDLDAALAFVRGFQDTSAALASLSDGEAARTVERLREMLAAHYSDERGVALDSRSWLITARRRRQDVDNGRQTRPRLTLLGPLNGSGARLWADCRQRSRVRLCSADKNSGAWTPRHRTDPDPHAYPLAPPHTRQSPPPHHRRDRCRTKPRQRTCSTTRKRFG